MRRSFLILIEKFVVVKRSLGFKAALRQSFWYLMTRRYASGILSKISILNDSGNLHFSSFIDRSIYFLRYSFRKSNRRHKCSMACDGSITPRISIIVPTIGRSKVLLQCLQSIAISAQKMSLGFEIILVVDSRTDTNESAFINSVLGDFRCNSLKVLHHVKFTSGFSGQVNAGAELAVGLDMLILNDDVIAKVDLLEKLLGLDWRTIDMIFSPVILNLDGTIQEFGSTISRRGESEWIGSGKKLSWIENLDYLQVDFTSAVCWLMNRSKFLETGGFSSFAGENYYEDTKFALNPDNGFKTYIISRAQVIHFLSQSSNQGEKKLVTNEVTRHLFRDWWQKHQVPSFRKLKVMALYLPQFYTTDYNDFWWGTGYTEWSALGNWEKQINEQPQRLVPGELGFYNLTDQSVIKRQSNLASHYGIDAFVVMTYWFNGIKLLDKPLELFLDTSLRTEFCLFWANESWSRKWDGHENELLLKQTHDVEDSKAFIYAHREYLAHPKYVKIKGKIVIYIYRRELFTDVKANLDAMRKEALRIGLGELYLVAFESFEQSRKREDPTQQGFDAAAEYPPHGIFPRIKHSNFRDNVFVGRTHDYNDVEKFYLERQLPNYPLIRGVMVGFDNTSRLKSKATIFQNSNYSNFERWFCSASKNSVNFGSLSDHWIIVNAWNEWSESAVLEPSIASGRDYLAAVKIVKDTLNELNVDIRHE